MKAKASKQPKRARPAVQLKDIKPKKNPKAGSTSSVDNWRVQR